MISTYVTQSAVPWSALYKGGLIIKELNQYLLQKRNPNEKIYYEHSKNICITIHNSETTLTSKQKISFSHSRVSLEVLL